jgi:Astacin (Peptidase family M12A)
MVGSLLAAILASTPVLGQAQDGADTDLGTTDVEAALRDVPPGYILVHGDIQVRETGYQRGAYIAMNSWPGGEVWYEFDSNVTTTNRSTFRSAMDQWEAVSSVRFHHCSNNNCSDDYVHVQSSSGNNSAVGLQGGEQVINITSWNSVFRQAHELGHALGMWHEQSRDDRDDYVTINWDNIESGKENNFEIQNDYRYGPYDFDSVMHYPRDAFSTNGSDTITVKPTYAQWQNRIGQRDHLSDLDQMTMSACMYHDSYWTVVAPSTLFFRLGTCSYPETTIAGGAALTSDGGTLWIRSGTYAAPGVSTRPMSWRAPAGDVLIR